MAEKIRYENENENENAKIDDEFNKIGRASCRERV